MNRCTLTFLLGIGLAHLALADVTVQPGESIQKAIDTAPSGSTIHIAAGTFTERLSITKPITLRGAGWDKTILHPVDTPAPTDKEKIAFADKLRAEQSPRARQMLVEQFIRSAVPATIAIDSADGVGISGLRIGGPEMMVSSTVSSDALVTFTGAKGRISDCAIVGPFGVGVMIKDGSNVDIGHTLVAAMSNVGVAVTNGSAGGRPAAVHLSECDIRNCYYTGVTLHSDDTTIDRCRISGSAWHGIRYDDCSPAITNSFIFANARSGIYASGKTHGTIRENVFYKNEMDGISCWFASSDTIECNTFVSNLREGVVVAGDAKPTLTRNVFAQNPIGLVESQINGRNGAAAGSPQPQLLANTFWKNPVALRRLTETPPLPEGNIEADPQFAAADKHDFTPADANAAGAHKAVEFVSPWPIQPEETAMVPVTDTRDAQQWQKQASR